MIKPWSVPCIAKQTTSADHWDDTSPGEPNHSTGLTARAGPSSPAQAPRSFHPLGPRCPGSPWRLRTQDQSLYPANKPAKAVASVLALWPFSPWSPSPWPQGLVVTNRARSSPLFVSLGTLLEAFSTLFPSRYWRAALLLVFLCSLSLAS